jgi:hypothetical protein
MTNDYKLLRADIRAMQMRLTVIGFNLAIVSFQLARLYGAENGLRVPGLGRSVHVVAEMELYMALGLSIIAVSAFIMSCEIDDLGFCTRWLMVTGNLLMYMALSHTIAGFFMPLTATIGAVGGALPQTASEIRVLQSGALAVGGAAWFLATYAGPLLSLKRSTYHNQSKIAFGIAYLLVLLVFCWLTSQTVIVESAVSGDQPGLILGVLRELVQPLRW